MDAEEAYSFTKTLRETTKGTAALGVAGAFVQIEQMSGEAPPHLIMAHAVALSAHGRAVYSAFKKDPTAVRNAMAKDGAREEVTKAIEIIEASMVLLKEALKQ